MHLQLGIKLLKCVLKSFTMFCEMRSQSIFSVPPTMFCQQNNMGESAFYTEIRPKWNFFQYYVIIILYILFSLKITRQTQSLHIVHSPPSNLTAIFIIQTIHLPQRSISFFPHNVCPQPTIYILLHCKHFSPSFCSKSKSLFFF